MILLMNKMKKMIGTALLGASIVGGVATAGAGLASAAPAQHHQSVQQHQKSAPAQQHQKSAPGQNRNWRPGPVMHKGHRYQPVWNQQKHHWGFWVGRNWVPVG